MSKVNIPMFKSAGHHQRTETITVGSILKVSVLSIVKNSTIDRKNSISRYTVYMSTTSIPFPNIGMFTFDIRETTA